MKLLICSEPDGQGKTYNVTDGHGSKRYHVEVQDSDRSKVFSILETNGYVAATLTCKTGIFKKTISYSTKSGDQVIITCKAKPERQALSVSGCDWTARGTDFPVSYYVDGGYGRIVAVQTRQDGIEAELSLTAVPQDVLCFVLSVDILFS